MGKKARNPRISRKTSAKLSADAPGAEKAIVAALSAPVGRPSSLLDTRVIYCGDCWEQLQKLPAECVDLIYIDPPFNSNRNYEVFWGETKEKRSFEDRHASTQAYIDYMRPRCVVLKPQNLVSVECIHVPRCYSRATRTARMEPIPTCAGERRQQDCGLRIPFWKSGHLSEQPGAALQSAGSGLESPREIDLTIPEYGTILVEWVNRRLAG